MTIDECAQRFVLTNADLLQARHPPVTVGLAIGRTGDSLEAIIQRADASLYRERER